MSGLRYGSLALDGGLSVSRRSPGAALRGAILVNRFPLFAVVLGLELNAYAQRLLAWYHRLERAGWVK